MPAKWRERRAMRVTVSACPRTARLRRCQKPCTSGVTHRSLPSALRKPLHKTCIPLRSVLHTLIHSIAQAPLLSTFSRPLQPQDHVQGSEGKTRHT